MKLAINSLKSNRSPGGETTLTECMSTFSVPAEYRNESIEAGAFLDCLEEAIVILFSERAILLLSKTIAQLVHLVLIALSKSMKFQVTEKRYLILNITVSEKCLVLNMPCLTYFVSFQKS